MRTTHIKSVTLTLSILLSAASAIAQTIIPAGFGAMSVNQPSRETAVLTGILNSTGEQNPTVKIRWGDEDRGTAVTPSTAWDNEVTISTNQAAGTFSTTITIPNLEKVYYFRSIASNSGGTVVSRSVGVLLPSAPVGVANLQGRWAFDGGNANDSSGTGRHGIAKKLFSPIEVSTMKLWLDAADSSTITHNSNAVSQWSDKSGNGRHATTSLGSPTLNSTSGPNNKPVVEIRRAGGDDALSVGGTAFFAKEHYYVFRSVNANFDYYGGVLGHGGSSPGSRQSNYLFRNGQNYFHHDILPGGVSKNGIALSGNFSLGTINQFMILKLTNTDTNVGPHSNYRVGTVAEGFCASIDIAEIIAFSTSLSQEKANKIEGYLAHKWGLAGSLASSHPYKLGTPTSASGTPTYIADTPFGSGKAIDLADGHVEVSTGESEDVFDGGAAFSVSAWVKGWPTESYAPFVSKGATFPKPSNVASLKLWLDGADTSVMDKGTSLGASGTPANGNNVKFWGDKSGNGYHAISTQTPTYNTTGINNGFPGINTNGDAYLVENSAADFDAWDSMTLFFVTKWGSSSYWTWGIEKGQNYNGSAGWQVQRMNTGAGQATGMWFARPGTSHTRRTGTWGMDARTDTKIITMRYDGAATNMKFYANGSYQT
ncbi:hypothetical protein N9A58_09735, partial [Opitutales bacterium]|nr:hypothetical protein [Opitutales bacterium]